MLSILAVLTLLATASLPVVSATDHYYLLYPDSTCQPSEGQYDQIGEDFMLSPYWFTDECFWIDGLYEVHAKHQYQRTPAYSYSNLTVWWPAVDCNSLSLPHTMTFEYRVSVDGDGINCVQGSVHIFNRTYSYTYNPWFTIIEPPTNADTGILEPEVPVPALHKSLEGWAVSLIIAFAIVGVLAIMASAYVWWWKRRQAEREIAHLRLLTAQYNLPACHM